MSCSLILTIPGKATPQDAKGLLPFKTRSKMAVRACNYVDLDDHIICVQLSSYTSSIF